MGVEAGTPPINLKDNCHRTLKQGYKLDEVIYTKDEATIHIIDSALTLVQEKLVDKFPNVDVNSIKLTDPTDNRIWQINIGTIKKHKGKIQETYFYTRDYDNPESFTLHNIREGEESTLISSQAFHLVNGIVPANDTALEMASAAEAKLRSLLLGTN